MAAIKLRIIGLPRAEDSLEEENIEVENITEIIQRLEFRYPRDYYTYAILLNGVKVDESSKSLREGDEVIVIPTMSGG